MACQRWRRGWTARVTHVVGPAQCLRCGSIFSFRIPWKDVEKGLEEMACPCCHAPAGDFEVWTECVTAEIACT